MIDVAIRRVEPAELLAQAKAFPDSLIACQFDEPLTPDELQAFVAAVSDEPIAPDSVWIRTIRNEPEVTDSTALSLDSLAPHTDGSFVPIQPWRLILSCARCDDQRLGASTLIPGNVLVGSAPGWVVDALTSERFRFLKTYDGDLTDSFVGPVLSRRDDGTPQLRWRGDHLYRPEPVEPRGSRAGDAVEWLYDWLQTCDPFTYVVETGELLIIPNDLMVHGRQALCDNSQRTLLRAWAY